MDGPEAVFYRLHEHVPMFRPRFNASESGMRPSVMAVATREMVTLTVIRTVWRKRLHHRRERPKQQCSGA